jgi:heat shock 70kDa protein 4
VPPHSLTLLLFQDWLYDEGEDQTKSVYVEKLRGHGEPIETRYVEAGVRKPAAQKLRGTANAYLAAAQSPDARYAHIDAGDKKKVRMFVLLASYHRGS